jgi:hypothetical protein
MLLMEWWTHHFAQVEHLLKTTNSQTISQLYRKIHRFVQGGNFWNTTNSANNQMIVQNIRSTNALRNKEPFEHIMILSTNQLKHTNINRFAQVGDSSLPQVVGFGMSISSFVTDD